MIPIGSAPEGALSVSELSNQMREALVREVGRVTAYGELSNFKSYGPGGNWYFTLKDGQSQVRGVMFSRDRRTRYQPRDGDEVLVRGRVDLYPARGDVQLIVDRMDPLGAGRLQEEFEQLKARLAAEGLFDAARKRRLPAVPRHIGIVTSPQAAALQDMLRTLRGRDPTLTITLAPARVQGDGAGATIAAALDLLNRCSTVEVILLGRGGGSLEDLWAFNEEVVARAIARSRVPIISGVGHETDTTIADFVADLRCPTPTGAAERVVPVRRDLEAAIADLRGRLIASSGRILARRGARVEELRARLLSPQRRLELASQRLDDLRARLQRGLVSLGARRRDQLAGLHVRLASRDPQRRIASSRVGLLATRERLVRAAILSLQRRRSGLDGQRRQLQLVGPLQSLERGYALALDDAGRVLRDAADRAVGDPLTVRLHRGALRCTVSAVLDPDPLDLLGRAE